MEHVAVSLVYPGWLVVGGGERMAGTACVICAALAVGQWCRAVSLWGKGGRRVCLVTSGASPDWVKSTSEVWAGQAQITSGFGGSRQS